MSLVGSLTRDFETLTFSVTSLHNVPKQLLEIEVVESVLYSMTNNTNSQKCGICHFCSFLGLQFRDKNSQEGSNPRISKTCLCPRKLSNSWLLNLYIQRSCWTPQNVCQSIRFQRDQQTIEGHIVSVFPVIQLTKTFFLYEAIKCTWINSFTR